jgi:hypothetical protein
MNPRPLVSFLSLSLLAASCIIVVDGEGHVRNHFAYSEGIRGSGVVKTESRTVGEFERIVVEGSTDVSVRAGEAQSVTASGDDNLVGFITTEVREGALFVGMKSGSYSPHTHMHVSVAVPALESVQVRGSADVDVEGLAGESFEVGIQGSGDVKASGKVGRVEASVSGSGDMKLDGLEAREARVSVSGSGDVEVWAADSLVVSIAGSGDVTYRGDPKLTKSIAGSGDLRRR